MMTRLIINIFSIVGAGEGINTGLGVSAGVGVDPNGVGVAVVITL